MTSVRVCMYLFFIKKKANVLICYINIIVVNKIFY